MNKDLNKGITEIQYNSLNLPGQMVINSSTFKAKNYYTYSASGVKLKTEQRYDPTLSVAPVSTTTPANDGFVDYKNTDYVGNIIYETEKKGTAITNKTKILVDGGYIENNVYHYYLTDHLGNNRVVANASGTVIQKNHYYPFGTAFADKYDNGTNQPYKYNGKELDQMHGLNLYDYSARYMDAAIGRFTTVDPLAEKYYSISPYAYCNNNPLRYIDPTGMWIQHSDSTGSYRYNNGQWEQYQTSGANAGQYTAYTPASGSFMEGVLNGLNKLNNNVTGNALLEFFANDDNNAFIVAGTENTADIGNSALGRIWLSSTFQGSDIPTENGIQTSPFWLDIGHELSHRQDVLKNGATQAGATWLTKPDGTTVKASEKYATHMENLMRADAGLPLRTHYVQQGTGGWENSRVLNSGTRTSTFYGTTYRSTPRIVIPKGLIPSRK